MDRYSVLLIPENHLEAKRFHLSRAMVYVAFALVVLFLTYSASMTWGFLHYRKVALSGVESVSPADELFKSQLLAKMNALEESLNRTQQFTTRMESRLGVDTNKLKIGVGSSEHEDLNKYLEKLNSQGRLHLSDPGESHTFYERLGGKLEELSEYALSLETRVNEVYELSQDKFAYWASTPSLWPVKGWVTSDFGSRSSPWTGEPKFHEGLDIAAPIGSPIYAPADGYASFTGYKGGYGNALILDHGYGLSTLYGHTSSVLVKEGEKVKRGQLVALVGSTGSSTGPHLHYEVHVDGVPTDPLKYILR